MRVKAVVLGGLAALLCAGSGVAQEKVTICGTGDNQELLRRIGEGFTKANPGIAVEVPDSVGSTGGIKAAAAGECDLGRVARLLDDKEKQLGLTYRVFAYSPVVFVADPDAKVGSITTKQVVDVFAGKVANWKELGGADAKIQVVNREAKDSSRNELNNTVPGFKDVASPVGATANKTPEAVELLLKTKYCLGYLPLSAAKGKALAVLSLDGVAPTGPNVVGEKYKAVSPFALVWKGDPKPATKKFLEYLRGKEARQAIIDFGIVPSEMM